jgi:hypothetical protein
MLVSARITNFFRYYLITCKVSVEVNDSITPSVGSEIDVVAHNAIGR